MPRNPAASLLTPTRLVPIAADFAGLLGGIIAFVI